MAALGLGTAKELWNFDPRTIPGCTLWLDAQDSSSITGSPITTWRDKSGAGNNATSAAGPTTSTYNGYPVALFNGTSQYMTSANTVPRTAHTLIAVHRPATTNVYLQGNTRLFSYQNVNIVVFPYLNGTIARGYIADADGAGAGSIDYGNSTLVENSVTTAFNIISATIQSGSQLIHKNGAQQTSASQSLSGGTSDSLTIGRNNTGPFEYYQGSLGEMIVYSVALTATQRQQVEGYLARKWGLLASLPATHVYRNTPIYTRIFNPLDVSGCLLWLDAADSTTLTLSGTSVTQWNDKSGNSNNVSQGTVAKMPTYSNSIINFVPAQTLTSTGTFSLGLSNVTAFAVLQYSASSTQDTCLFQLYALDGGTDYLSSNSMFLSYQTTPRTELYYCATGGLYNTSSPNNRTLYSLNARTKTITAFRNGTSYGSRTPTLAGGTATKLLLNQRYVSGAITGNGATGSVCEVILYPTNLSTSQQQQIEGYLANKWSLRSVLNATNPFASRLLPATPKFLPGQISGLSLWLDAADTTTLTLSGSNVTQWNDKSGNAKHFTSSGNPTSGNTTLGGYNILNLTGGGSFSNASYTLPAVYSMFIVAYTSASGLRTLLSASTDVYILVRMGGILWGTGTGGWNGGISYPATTPNIASFIVNTNGSLWMNGASSAATGSGVAASFTGTIGLGYRIGSSEPWGGYIAEFLIYNSALGGAERQQLEGYLAKKWNLNSLLPTTHPYYKIKP